MESKLLSIPRFYFVLGFTILSILVMLLLIWVTDISGIRISERPIEEKTFWFLFIALILAPVIETFIFQKLPIDFFRDNVKKDWPLVLVSAIPFGLVHYIAYFFVRDIIYSLCVGSVLAYAYIIANKREDINAYLSVVIIHAGYNLFGVIIQLIFV